MPDTWSATVLDKLGASVWTSTPFRLAALSIAAFLVTAAGIAGFMFWQTNDLLTGQVLAGLRAEVQEMRHMEAAAGSASVAAAIKARARPEGPGLYFFADKSGRKQAGNLSRQPPELSSEGGGTFRYEREPGDERLAVALPISFSDGTRLLVGRDIEEQRVFANHMRTVFLLGFGLLSAAGLAGGLGAGRLLLNRIDQINAASRSIMAGDLSRRVPVAGSQDELDGLAGNLNAMLDRIEQLMGGMREVSDNIAHDLKTPLSRLRNRAEATLRDGGGDCAAYRAGLERIIEEADELIKTFNAMLLVARLEAGALDGEAEAFDIGGLVRDVAEFYEPLADEQGLDLTVEAEDGAPVVANRHLVNQAVANLIDNAIKYGRPETPDAVGSIRVTLRILTETVEIAVEDRGPGISADDRERALKRFVRLEASRTKPGTGLGLSLVAAVARLHHGTVRLEDNAPGLRAVLVLPRARQGISA